MASNDPKLLYAIPGVSAYHIANGTEDSLTPAGPQTLSLLMVPTASSFADASIDNSTTSSGAGQQEEDFYLHLHLPPELDLPLPATTQIYHQPPSSYLIPRWDLGNASGVFTRIEFPPVGSRKGLQEDVDTFETILAQCTAFLERAPPPKISSRKEKSSVPSGPAVPSAAVAVRASVAAGAAGASGLASSSRSTSHYSQPQQPYDQQKYNGGYPDSKRSHSQSQSKRPSGSRSSSRTARTEDLPAYNPAEYKPGEAYAAGSHSSNAGGQIVLIDEEDGSVIGEIGEGYQVIEDQALMPGSKDPVEIVLPTESHPNISVKPIAPQLIDEELHPAYKKSVLVSNALVASRLIIATSEMVSKALQGQADKFAEKAEPVNKPITFQPSTHAHIRRINTLSSGAAGLSAKAVGQIGKVAQNVGAKLAGHKSPESGSGSTKSRKSRTGLGPDGQPLDDFRPGLLNKSLMAFSTVADGIEQAGRHLLDTSSNAATTVVASKWGNEAGEVTRHLTGGIKNVGLVYIDVTGVSRRAIIKSVAKGMVVGHVPGGGDLIVGGTEASGSNGPAAIGPGKNNRTNTMSSISTSSSATPPPLPSVPRPMLMPSNSSSSSLHAPISRTRSTQDLANNNPFRGR